MIAVTALELQGHLAMLTYFQAMRHVVEMCGEIGRRFAASALLAMHSLAHPKHANVNDSSCLLLLLHLLSASHFTAGLRPHQVVAFRVVAVPRQAVLRPAGQLHGKALHCAC